MKAAKGHPIMFFRIVAAFVGSLLWLICAPASAEDPPALNVHLAKDQGCLIRLSGGPLMRVPPAVLGYRPSCSATAPTNVQLLRLVINYPEITPGEWVGILDRHFAKLHHTDVLHPDNFPVNILHIFYPEQIKNATLDQWSGVEPQVWQIKKRQFSDGDLMGWSNETRIVNSTIKPLRQLEFYRRKSKPSPYTVPGKIYDRSLGHLIEPNGADYDLWMDCDGEIECEAWVQINSNHIQYRFLMPYEAVPHASEVIRALNQLIDDWLQK